PHGVLAGGHQRPLALGGTQIPHHPVQPGGARPLQRRHHLTRPVLDRQRHRPRTALPQVVVHRRPEPRGPAPLPPPGPPRPPPPPGPPPPGGRRTGGRRPPSPSR